VHGILSDYYHLIGSKGEEYTIKTDGRWVFRLRLESGPDFWQDLSDGWSSLASHWRGVATFTGVGGAIVCTLATSGACAAVVGGFVFGSDTAENINDYLVNKQDIPGFIGHELLGAIEAAIYATPARLAEAGITAIDTPLWASTIGRFVTTSPGTVLYWLTHVVPRH
jgi:hypothetical protein